MCKTRAAWYLRACASADMQRLLCALCLCYASASPPLRGLKQLDPEIVIGGHVGSVANFLKTLYAGITDGDVKTLAVRFVPQFEALCEQDGRRRVIRELVLLQELRISDLEITLGHMHKLSLLLQRMFSVDRGDGPEG